MYRRSKKYQQLRAKIARSIAKREDKRIQNVSEIGVEPLLPDLRKKIEVTSYDMGESKTITFELFQSDRIDCYKVLVDGKLWKKRVGLSKILEGIRKALPRHSRLE
ncbi:MAG: hypothetical protein CL679_01540 [Bermanella sp.]|nr:hypothetical protein [Bermanella sp.]|tara:strand:+ start:78 stop:395 length:318 start_codon:yes stop_codon:yes gene_type:complete